jgi:hypothetical protein
VTPLPASPVWTGGSPGWRPGSSPSNSQPARTWSNRSLWAGPSALSGSQDAAGADPDDEDDEDEDDEDDGGRGRRRAPASDTALDAWARPLQLDVLPPAHGRALARAADVGEEEDDDDDDGGTPSATPFSHLAAMLQSAGIGVAPLMDWTPSPTRPVARAAAGPGGKRPRPADDEDEDEEEDDDDDHDEENGAATALPLDLTSAAYRRLRARVVAAASHAHAADVDKDDDDDDDIDA